MPYCTKCGKLLADSAKFCTSCGAPVEGTEPAVPVVPATAPMPPQNGEASSSTAPVATSSKNAGAVANDAQVDAGATVRVAAVGTPRAGDDARDPLHAEPDPFAYQPTTAMAPNDPAASPGTTQRFQMPAPVSPVAAAAPSPAFEQAATQPGQPAPKKTNGALIGIIIFLVAVIIALVVIFVIKPFGNGEQAAPTKTEQTTASKKSEIKEPEVKGDSNNPGAEDTSTTKDEAKAAEENIYSELSAYYGKLSGYDQQVRDAASAFNSEYLKSDMSSRRTTAAAAEALEDELDDLKDEVEDLDVPVSSQNYASWKSIIALYDDLCHRIEVICDAWEVSLEYSDPSAHQDEIVAPLARDNVAGTNDNKYRLDYEDRYANAAPVEVK